MKKFRFRLQKVLEFKAKIEEDKKNELAKHISDYNRVAQRIEEAHVRKDQILETLSRRIDDFTYRALARQSLAGIYQTFVNGKRELEEIQKRIDRARLVYLKAKKEKEIFEKFRKKAYNKYKEEIKKKQKKIMDEAGVRVWSTGRMREFERT